MLVDVSQYLGTDFRHSGWISHLLKFTRDLSDQICGVVGEWAVMVEFIHWVTPVQSPDESGIRPVSPMSRYPNLSWRPCR